MLNQMIVLKQPIGRPSGFLTSFHPPLRSSTSTVVISPPIVHMKSCNLSLHPLCIASPKPINCINKTIPTSQMKDDDDKEDSDEPIMCECDANEDNGVVYITCEMPGLDKEDVIKIITEKNQLDVKAKKRQETSDNDDDKGWKYFVNFTFILGLSRVMKLKPRCRMVF